MCELEVAFKSMVQNIKNGVAESAATNKKSSSNMGRAGESGVNNLAMRMNCDYEKRRMEEKAEILFHLIFWGPN